MKFDKELWDEWDVSYILQQVEMIRKHGCKKISLMKWHPDNPERGYGSCPYCLTIGSCTDCPLSGETCGAKTAVWNQWSNERADNNTEKANELADKMFHAIMKIDEEM
jgi:hypothetical protein